MLELSNKPAAIPLLVSAMTLTVGVSIIWILEWTLDRQLKKAFNIRSLEIV